jgi:hypothetical protein
MSSGNRTIFVSLIFIGMPCLISFNAGTLYMKHKKNLLYGVAVKHPAILNKLQVMQIQSLRLMTGAVKSTPLASMQILTMNNPSKIEGEKKALILHEKLTCLPYISYRSENKHQDRNLKAPNGFMQVIAPL